MYKWSTKSLKIIGIFLLSFFILFYFLLIFNSNSFNNTIDNKKPTNNAIINPSVEEIPGSPLPDFVLGRSNIYDSAHTPSIKISVQSTTSTPMSFAQVYYYFNAINLPEGISLANPNDEIGHDANSSNVFHSNDIITFNNVSTTAQTLRIDFDKPSLMIGEYVTPGTHNFEIDYVFLAPTEGISYNIQGSFDGGTFESTPLINGTPNSSAYLEGSLRLYFRVTIDGSTGEYDSTVPIKLADGSPLNPEFHTFTNTSGSFAFQPNFIWNNSDINSTNPHFNNYSWDLVPPTSGTLPDWITMEDNRLVWTNIPNVYTSYSFRIKVTNLYCDKSYNFTIDFIIEYATPISGVSIIETGKFNNVDIPFFYVSNTAPYISTDFKHAVITPLNQLADPRASWEICSFTHNGKAVDVPSWFSVTLNPSTFFAKLRVNIIGMDINQIYGQYSYQLRVTTIPSNFTCESPILSFAITSPVESISINKYGEFKTKKDGVASLTVGKLYATSPLFHQLIHKLLLLMLFEKLLI